MNTFNVTMRFQHPAYDEKEGILFEGIVARTKALAIKEARRQAERDGHTGTGKGRYTFTAVEEAGQ